MRGRIGRGASVVEILLVDLDFENGLGMRVVIERV